MIRPIATCRRSWRGWRRARWAATPPDLFVQHHAELLVIRSGEDRAIELGRIARRQIAEIVEDHAGRLDRRLPDRHSPRRKAPDAGEESAFADHADERHRMHMLGHFLAGEEIDASHFDAGN